MRTDDGPPPPFAEPAIVSVALLDSPENTASSVDKANREAGSAQNEATSPAGAVVPAPVTATSSHVAPANLTAADFILPDPTVQRPLEAWFTKKAEGFGKSQKRWFVLVGTTVTYYAKQDDPAANRQPKGAFQVGKTTSCYVQGQDLVVENPDRVWQLKAESEAIASEWCEAMQARKVRSMTLVTLDSLIADSSTDNRSRRGTVRQAGPMCGWLVKKAEHRGADKHRFFQMADGEVEYFADVVDGRGHGRKGSIVITGATTVSVDGLVINVTNPDRVWCLTATSEEDALDWETAISVAAAAASKDSASPFDGQGTNAAAGLPGPDIAAASATGTVSAASVPDASVAAVPLNEMPVDAATPALSVDNGGEIAPAPAAAAEVRLGTHDPPTVAADSALPPAQPVSPTAQGGDAGVTSAWFVKKAKSFGKSQRRYFVLDGREIRYYSSAEGDLTSHYVGTISITSTTSVQSSGADLVINNPDRTWHLTAESPAIASMFASAVVASHSLLLVHPADDVSSASSAEEEDMPMLDSKGVWMHKKAEGRGGDKRRYFTVV